LKRSKAEVVPEGITPLEGVSRLIGD